MKKFLSLLLALTLVLSLVVVPARANGEDDTPKINGLSITKSVDSVDRGDDVKFEVTATSPSLSGIEGSPAIDADSYEYSWNVGSNFKVNSGATAKAVQTTAIKAIDKTAVSCTVTCSYTVGEGEAATHGTVSTVVTLDNIAITNKLLPTDIDRVTFNGRTFDVTDGSVTISTIGDEQIGGSANTWKAHSKTEGYTIDNETNKPSYASNKLTVKTTDTSPLSTEISVNSQKASVSAAANPTEVVTGGGKTTLTATPTGLSNSAAYKWYLKKTSGTDDEIGTGKTFTWTAPTVSASTDYKVYCKASETVSGSTVPAATSNEVTVKVVPDIYRIDLNKTSLSFNKLNESQSFKAWFKYLDSSSNTYKDVEDIVIYNYSSSNPSAVSVASASNSIGEADVKLTSNVASAKVTVSVTYKGRTFTKDVSIYGSFLDAYLDSVQNGSTATYSYSTLVSAAQSAINRNNNSTYETVYSLSNVRQIAPLTYGTGISTATYTYNIGGSGQLTFVASSSSIGTAKFSADVTTRTSINSAGTNKSYSITFNVPVKPITTTYADQYPEPVASGNTYRYYVQVPSGARYYYVAGVNNEPSDWNNGSGNKYYTTTSSTSLYSLTDSNFTNGKCTLYVVTQGTDYKLYCGTITVYQKNYNINYNGVAGETVQFAQSDFTDFMTEIAEARGDASKTKSYPYVTFDSVTFSLPTTSQGTLYYGGTAMSTSNSSGAFNTRTKVTNLDSVTFVPNAKSTAKTITLNFTLYATRYSSSSTSRGTTVSYSGSVVVNLVREDIKYTVSQGDSVRFDESDFLSYLRSTKGYTSNYTIDYVTFDQSAVSAVNEGSLYTYYNGYNYGGSVKTTDKFYYSATASQNALSDVAFLASRYAKTGETVYIPFTIYARYGTTGTGTRQLTGTVAIKIGQTMNFIDVKTTDYFYNSVKWAVGKNITNGTSSTTFSPYKSCTRAEIVTFLWRAAGSPEPTTTRNPFRDVNAVTHSSYYKAILWASQKGITSGTSATAFSPDQVCTRAQIVTFLYRYAGQPSGYYSNPFKDVGATSEASYYKAILWAVGKGITTGTSATTFSPYASCNRAEAVTFLYRYTNGL